MGLSLDLNLFYEVDARDVYDAYAAFYAKRGEELIASGDDSSEFTLYHKDQGWTTLWLGSCWEWERVLRRQAQLHVSRQLNCKGFLVFVYDGDYWGYEFFKHGKVLDHFVQDEEPGDGSNWFPDDLCEGNPQLIAHHFPHLTASDLAAYMVCAPRWAKWNEELATEQHWPLRTCFRIQF